MRLKELSKRLPTLLRRHYKIIVYAFIICTIALLGYFGYQNIYLTIIEPKQIASNEIIAKRQKVNVQLFNQITASIETKKNTNTNSLSTLNNPFAE